MKILSSRSSRGFTLMELLVVVTLIAILAGMVLAAMPGILARIKRTQIVNFLAEIEAGLDEYKIDNGLYPMSPEGGEGAEEGDDATAIGGAVILYQHLSGDFDMDSNGEVDPGVTVYVDRLAFWTNNDKPAVERSVQFRSGYAVVDPLGSPLRYLAEPPGVPAAEKKTRNPTYDLWSVGGAEGESTGFQDQAKWITNWGN